MKLIQKGYEIPLEIMKTPTQRNKGMMGRKSLEGGMLFLFRDIQELSFWMKNCLIPLDIVFMVNNKVTNIEKNATPCSTTQCPYYRGVGNMVLELNGGETNTLDIKKGDKLVFK
jgi:hypothetical protein